jgi:hypothetical protein
MDRSEDDRGISSLSSSRSSVKTKAQRSLSASWSNVMKSRSRAAGPGIVALVFVVVRRGNPLSTSMDTGPRSYRFTVAERRGRPCLCHGERGVRGLVMPMVSLVFVCTDQFGRDGRGDSHEEFLPLSVFEFSRRLSLLDVETELVGAAIP